MNRFTLFLLLSLVFVACTEDDSNSYDIPEIYNFENVSYPGQKDRLAMLGEWKTYMSSAQTAGVSLDETRMLAMFNNSVDAQFSQTYTKQIESKTEAAQVSRFKTLISELAAASASSTAGSNGVSGVINSTTNSSKSYLVGDDGLDHAQIIEKGLMGACFYYQASSVYLGTDRMDVDNTTIESEEGTAMEHHWDEAFGYFGAPLDFPSNLNDLNFWGNYSNQRNAVLGSNQKMMDQLLKGRAAISNDDISARDEAIAEVRKQWELIAVGSAIHYLNSCIDLTQSDMALFSHAGSEVIGFIYALKFNSEKSISNTEIDALLTLVAGSSNFASMNLYNTTIANLQTAKDQLANSYGLNSLKDEL